MPRWITCTMYGTHVPISLHINEMMFTYRKKPEGGTGIFMANGTDWHVQEPVDQVDALIAQHPPRQDAQAVELPPLRPFPPLDE